jgi:hypothetical protein
VLTSNWCLIAREFGGPSKLRKQRTAISAGALIDDAKKSKKWKAIDWQYIRPQVRRLQVRIAKAVTDVYPEEEWPQETAFDSYHA